MTDKLLMEIIREDATDFIPRTFNRGPYDGPVDKHYRVSICTNCMNRTSDLKQTYIKNLEENMEYPHVDFVLLNYNSKDDMDEWAKKNLMKYIEKGVLNYYHTTEPQYYSMTHSRNVAFKLAQGDIVNNVDADHYTNPAHGSPIKYRGIKIDMSFAEYINVLANHQHKQAVFLKSKQKNRGRLGFYKEDFLWLGGYDEGLHGYGHDDYDLLNRALCAGFTCMFFTGDYFSHTDDHKRHPTGNYKNKDWRYTQRLNTLISLLNLKYGKFQANLDRHWGKAKLLKNWTEEIDI
jgi:hypothetical protein